MVKWVPHSFCPLQNPTKHLRLTEDDQEELRGTNCPIESSGAGRGPTSSS